AAHSLKGASRAVGMGPVEKIAHRMESIFDGVQSGKVEMRPEVADALYDALDAIQILLDGSDADFDLDSRLATLTDLAAPEQQAASTAISVAAQSEMQPDV